MPMNQALLAEFEHEMAGTRRTLERVPFEKAEWRPHPKSFPLASLATHLARVPGWAKEALTQDFLDLAATDPAVWSAVAASSADLLALFDRNVAAGKAAIAATDDAAFMKPWSLRNGDKVQLTMPKVAVLRGFVLSHAIHHRAQLGVYLRMLDVPVPAIYGPSADEAGV